MKNIVLSLVRLLTLALLAAPFSVFAAEPTVTYITAKQRYPWNGLVDISCKVSGIEADAGGYEFAVVAVNKETGREYTVSNFSVKHNGEEVPDVCDNGDYSLLWNARDDMGQVIIERMTVRITLEGIALSIGKVQLWEGGPYWADRNIGAKKPEDSGLYFWWGDTKGHRPSSDGTFRFDYDWHNPEIYTEGKSVAELQNAGWVTSSDALLPAHDAAHIKWGGNWRMPTDHELWDLYTKCHWTWTTLNGVNGYIVRGRGDYVSNSIFLPAAGFSDWYGGSHLVYSGSYGWYWSSTLDSYNEPYNYAWHLYFGSDKIERYGLDYRYCGYSIRPVQDFTK